MHVVLALPGDVEVLPFLVELWRARVASGSLADHYEPAPVVVGVEPSSFMVDVGCVHQAVRLWSGREHGEALSPAEAAVRQVEAADVLLVPAPAGGDGEQACAATALASRLNPRARLVTSPDINGSGPELRASLVRAAPPGAEGEWQARLEPVTVPATRYGAGPGAGDGAVARPPPLHPGRLADALPVAMGGVVRGRGHLWLCSRPDSVVTWRSAGAHLELREADRWLEPAHTRAWQAASPQRRALASEMGLNNGDDGGGGGEGEHGAAAPAQTARGVAEAVELRLRGRRVTGPPGSGGFIRAVPGPPMMR
ncbi:GTP-binding protein [Streptomyces sp. V4I2]|uniref:GTP-binding protein n=1 Tax=Streptomyces sp. V4I2 TaxID=3042280 RepID=UPI0027D89245|nr:GTP-binding protein [Streptomyces sp. V4I2]